MCVWGVGGRIGGTEDGEGQAEEQLLSACGQECLRTTKTLPVYVPRPVSPSLRRADQAGQASP